MSNRPAPARAVIGLGIPVAPSKCRAVPALAGPSPCGEEIAQSLFPSGRKGWDDGNWFIDHVPAADAERSHAMSVAKIIEISAESTRSFEDAIRQGIETASKTVRNIRAAWVKEQQVVVEGGNIAKYRVDLKVTFVLE
jgi:flavin-binding protein dodecin